MLGAPASCRLWNRRRRFDRPVESCGPPLAQHTARADEAHRQSEIRSELLPNLFTASDLGRDESLTTAELLARGEARVRGNLEGEPLATQLEILGRLYGPGSC